MNIDSHPESSLPWTGERYLPEIGGEIQLEHVHRYLVAREYARGKDVLDIACGEGFGSAILGGAARSVIGVTLPRRRLRTPLSAIAGITFDFSWVPVPPFRSTRPASTW